MNVNITHSVFRNPFFRLGENLMKVKGIEIIHMISCKNLFKVQFTWKNLSFWGLNSNFDICLLSVFICKNVGDNSFYDCPLSLCTSTLS